MDEVCNLLHVLSDQEYDLNVKDSLWWNVNMDTKQIDVFFDCSDVFLWGCSDSEQIFPSDVEDIKQAMADVYSISGFSYADILWIARKRKQRPQVAWYWTRSLSSSCVTDVNSYEFKMKQLLDACGSEEDQYGTKAFNDKHVEPVRKKNIYQKLDKLCELQETTYAVYSFHTWMYDIEEFQYLAELHLTHQVPFTKYILEHMKDRMNSGRSTSVHVCLLGKMYREQISVPDQIRGKVKELSEFYHNWVMDNITHIQNSKSIHAQQT